MIFFFKFRYESRIAFSVTARNVLGEDMQQGTIDLPNILD